MTKPQFLATALTISIGLLAPAGMAVADDANPSTPVNCATAEGDIRALNAEKEFARSHRLGEAFSLIPAGALLGILTGTEREKLEMLSPEYIKRIDARLDEIETTCKLN